jgi:structural maintenance of chromosome 4
LCCTDEQSELIHKSDKYPDLQYCEVFVHFCRIIDHQNDEKDGKDGNIDNDGYTIVPGSDFVISRHANLKSESKYKIDGKLAKWEVGHIHTHIHTHTWLANCY